jgi:hypothetical protein
LSRTFAENQTDEEGAMLRCEVEDHAVPPLETKRPAVLRAGVIPEFGKGRAGRLNVLEDGTPEGGGRTESVTEFFR